MTTRRGITWLLEALWYTVERSTWERYVVVET